MAYDASKKAEGASASTVGPPLAIGMQGMLVMSFFSDCVQSMHAAALPALGVGMGMVQSIVAAMLDVVPPLIPPPVWNNMPLPCAPMITGACFRFARGGA